MAACSAGLAVSFNGEQAPRSFRDYFALFDLHTLGSVFAEAPGFQLGVGVVESSSSNTHVSFVNSINTLRGGTHVTLVLDQIAKGVVREQKRKKKDAQLNQSLVQKVSVMKKDSSLPAVTPAFVRAHLAVFVNARISNPTFDSQTKETLTTSPEAMKDVCVVPQDLIQQVWKKRRKE